VHDAIAVRVLQRLTDLTDDGQCGLQRDRSGLLGPPQVESLPALLVRVDQADPELGLDQVAGAQHPVVGEPADDAVFVGGDGAQALPLLLTGTRRGDLEADPAPVGLADPVEPFPVLPALTLRDRLVFDDPGAGLALASLHQADPLHQLDQDGLVDLLPGVGGFEQQVGESGEVGLRGVTVEAVEADRAGRGELGPEMLVVQEDRLLHERDNAADVGGVVHSPLADPGAELVLELAGKVLGLTARQLEWGVLGAFAVAQPGVVVAAEAPGVPLQFHQVEPSPAKHEQIDFVPASSAVAKLEVGPGPEWRLIREDLPDEAEPLRLMAELGRGYLDPAILRRRWHGPPSQWS
jgi:hypothetical protein